MSIIPQLKKIIELEEKLLKGRFPEIMWVTLGDPKLY